MSPRFTYHSRVEGSVYRCGGGSVAVSVKFGPEYSVMRFQ
jgi:hypothetical protein